MLAKVKRGRVWLSNTEKYRNKFVEIFIVYKNKKASFFAIIPKDGRFYIPKKIRENLKIKDSVKIERIKRIKNQKRITKLWENSKIDLLSIIPEQTMSGYEILVRNKNNKLHCWYCTQGRPKEILLNKYVPKSFIRLLGYYQAEGGKPKLRKRQGRSLNFTNKNFELIKDFIELSSHLINIELWKATIRYNKKIDKKVIKDLIKNLQNLGLKKENIYSKNADRIKNYVIKVWIANSILAEIIENLNKSIKEFLVKNRSEEMFVNYLRGFIAGDGNFFAYRDKKGSLHSRMYIYEEKEEYVKTHKKILDSYGLKGKIRKVKDKNLYLLTLVNNWEMLLNLLKYDLFTYAPHHRNRLIWTIKEHNKYRALKYLPFLPELFSIKELNLLTNKNYNYGASWIGKRKKEELIEFTKKEKNRSLWKLTKEGKDIREILNNLPSNLQILNNRI